MFKIGDKVKLNMEHINRFASWGEKELLSRYKDNVFEIENINGPRSNQNPYTINVGGRVRSMTEDELIRV